MADKENEKIYEYSALAGDFYPLLKITREEFPRLLATRKILNEKDEYFGAFLPETGVRIWLGLLNKIFRLRSCEIEIKGDFPQPCGMFYEKRCVAPCVAEICSREEYVEYVGALRLFLIGDELTFSEFMENRISEFAERLEFEKAAKWRDILIKSRKIFADKKLRLWLDDAVDTYEIEEEGEDFIIYLITTRGRKFLGGKTFVFPKTNTTAEQILSEIIGRFYVFHAPREIRLTRDFPTRKRLAKILSEKSKHPVKITIVKNEFNVSIKQKLKRAKFKYEFEKIGEPKSIDEITIELQKIFYLKKKPVKIEAFDVAHISGYYFVAASAAWENGEIAPEGFRFYAVDETSETGAMAKAVAERLEQKPFPDLLLVDGAIAQLRAAKAVLKKSKLKTIALLSAVKPAGKHNEISYFLTEDEGKIKFAAGVQAHELLRRLRDEAHAAANQAHRQKRDNQHLFEYEKIFRGFNAADRKKILKTFNSIKKLTEADEKKLVDSLGRKKAEKLRRNLADILNNTAASTIPIVPIRFDEIGGAATDLPPIFVNNF